MHHNRAFVLLLLGLVGLTLWFVSRAAIQTHHYYGLTHNVELDVEGWTIKGNGKDHYRLIAHYVSPFGAGEGAVGPMFRNPWAAEKAKKNFEKQSLSAWFNPKKRELCLEKSFPKKSILSALVLLGITVYFVALGVYVAAQNRKR